MSTGRHLLILGGGLAAHATAVSARANGFVGGITLVSEEPLRPYDRTPLSKAVLQGKRSAEDLFFQSEDDYREQRIELRTGVRATSVDLADRVVVLGSGETLEFDDLMIATGARPRRLPCPGEDLPGVHYLRTISDSLSIMDDLKDAETVLIAGAGFIGSEVAASARMLGKRVILADMLSGPMETALGEEISAVCAAIHEDHGVELRMNCRVVELHGTHQVEEAEFDNGERIPFDAVVAGIGVEPCIELFENAGLEIENGILVNEFCETSVPGVYAAGDIANWWHPELNRRFRVEHFDNAGAQGTAAGKVIAGSRDEPFAPVPYFWSDQYDTNIQYAGFPVEEYEVVLRGDPDQRQVTGFYYHDGEIHGAVTVNQPREFRAARRLVAARARIDPEVLTNPETDLRKLSREYR